MAEAERGLLMPVRSKQASETGEQAINQIRHLMKRFDDRLTLRNLRLAERYVKAELELLIHFCVRGVPEDFVAHLHRAEFLVGPEEDRQGWVLPPVGVNFGELTGVKSGHVTPKIEASEPADDGHEQAVLVGLVEFVDLPERVVPTLVRLGGVESIYCRLRHSMYLSSLLGFVFRGGVEDREVDIEERPGIPSTGQNELIGEVVESAPKVLNGIAGNGRELPRDGRDTRHVIDQLSRVRIVLGSDSIRVFVKEGGLCDLQLLDVVFGPFDLLPRAEQPIHHELSSPTAKELDRERYMASGTHATVAPSRALETRVQATPSRGAA
jgi:hypothetical protein